jgi:hypothetical protein
MSIEHKLMEQSNRKSVRTKLSIVNIPINHPNNNFSYNNPTTMPIDKVIGKGHETAVKNGKMRRAKATEKL